MPACIDPDAGGYGYGCSSPCDDGFVCVAFGGTTCVAKNGSDPLFPFGQCKPNDCGCMAAQGPSSQCFCQCTDQGAMIDCLMY